MNPHRFMYQKNVSIDFLRFYFLDVDIEQYIPWVFQHIHMICRHKNTPIQPQPRPLSPLRLGLELFDDIPDRWIHHIDRSQDFTSGSGDVDSRQEGLGLKAAPLYGDHPLKYIYRYSNSIQYIYFLSSIIYMFLLIYV